MNRQKVLAVFAAATMLGAVTVLAGGCGKQDESKIENTKEAGKTSEQSGKRTDEKYLLTVDGYGVTEDEFLLFLRDQKATTTNYYWTNYKMETNDTFWRTEVEGQTPLELSLIHI